MDEFSSLLLVGFIIPALVFLVKKAIVKKIIPMINDELSIKTKNGKKLRFTAKPDISVSEIKEIFEAELNFEIKVKKHIDNFIKYHNKSSLELSYGKYVDFIISNNEKVIGIEAKSNAERFKAKWISDYFNENNEMDKLIMIINSEIPSDILNEVKYLNPSKSVTLISSPNGRNLYKLVNNVLTTDFGLKK